MIEALAKLPTEPGAWGLIGDLDAAYTVASTIVTYLQEAVEEQDVEYLDDGERSYRDVLVDGTQAERTEAADKLIDDLRDYTDEIFPESGDPEDGLEDEEDYGAATEARCGLGDSESRHAITDHVYALFGVEDHKSQTFASIVK